jgi:glutaredoxin
MSSEFIVYSKTGCGYCTKLVGFLEQKEIPYVKLMLGEDYSTEEFIAKFGHGSTFPRVLLDEEIIGGMKDTVTYLVENKYV